MLRPGDNPLEKKEPKLSLKNRLLADIISGNLREDSFRYLGIVKNSVTTVLTKDIKRFGSLSDNGKAQVRQFLSDYQNPLKWQLIDRQKYNPSIFSGKLLKNDLDGLFLDLGGGFGFETGIWHNGNKLIGIDQNGRLGFEEIQGNSGYDIDDNKLRCYQQLFDKLLMLNDYFDIRYVSMKPKKLLLQKGCIKTDPLLIPYDSPGAAAVQKDANIIHDFMVQFLKEDNIGSLCHYVSPQIEELQRESNSFLIKCIARLPAILEVVCETPGGKKTIHFIMTEDNDWIAVTSE